MKNKVAKRTASSQELNKLKQPMKPILNIKKFEETTQWVIQRKPFEHLIRDLTRKRNTELKFQKTAIDALLEASEAYLVRLFEITGMLANNANRTTILPKDVHLAKRIFGDAWPNIQQ